MIIPDNRIIKLDGIDYVTSSDFAFAVAKSTTAVYHLINNGNRYRKLKVRKVGKNTYVELSELTKYPFTEPGPNGITYFYNEEGEVIKDV